MYAAPARRRAGFTLIELLVAIGLAIVITAVTVAVLNTGVIESQRVISSADRVSQWLITAKNRAKRDGRPRGVRFFRTGNFLTEAQYIELPAPFVPNPLKDVSKGRIVLVDQVNASNLVSQRDAFYVATNGDYSSFDNAPVQKDDFLLLPDFAQTFRITTAPDSSTQLTHAGSTLSPNGRHLTLASHPDLGAGGTPAATPSTATFSTYNYAFQSGPRPLFGEPVLQLSPDAVIDARGTTSLNVTPTGDFDVLFAPSGQVLNQTVGLLAFWIRDPNKTTLDPSTAGGFDQAGEQALVAVYTKTGAVATHPVVSAAAPYQAAKDGINAGF